MKRFYLQLPGREPTDITRMGSFILGRQGDLILEGVGVSRRHCMISLPKNTDERTYICDGDGKIASRNGTKVNNKIFSCLPSNKLNKGCYLANNDLITLGEVVIRYLEFQEEMSDDINATL